MGNFTKSHFALSFIRLRMQKFLWKFRLMRLKNLTGIMNVTIQLPKILNLQQSWTVRILYNYPRAPPPHIERAELKLTSMSELN